MLLICELPQLLLTTNQLLVLIKNINCSSLWRCTCLSLVWHNHEIIQLDNYLVQVFQQDWYRWWIEDVCRGKKIS